MTASLVAGPTFPRNGSNAGTIPAGTFYLVVRNVFGTTGTYTVGIRGGGA
jgi:hypothetical protein